MLKNVSAGVQQGNVLGPFLRLYTGDIPKLMGVTTATFADDTALLATVNYVETATRVNS